MSIGNSILIIRARSRLAILLYSFGLPMLKLVIWLLCDDEENEELIKARKAHAQHQIDIVAMERRSTEYLSKLSAQKLDEKNAQMALPPNSFLISLLIPSKFSEDIILNMEDLFGIWASRYGNKKARRIFKIQMFGVIFHHWIKPIKKLLIAAASYFGLTSIYELFK